MQELCRLDGKPVYYGVNRVSGCVIMADRTVNRNPNGLIFGTSGSGKSVSGKQEMIYIYLTTDDQIILCDPRADTQAERSDHHAVGRQPRLYQPDGY